MEKLSMEELEELREKEFDERAERAERIQNTISLFRKIACVLAVMIAAAFIFFHVRKDYNNYAGSQLVTAEVINVEGASDKNISVTYRYNIAGKEYESDKIQYIEKIRKGDISYEQSRCSTCSHGRSHESKGQSKKRFLIHAVIRTEKCGDRQAFSAD